jgi:gamma-glutamyl phosphate reductase
MDASYEGMLRRMIYGDYKPVAEVIMATAFSEKPGDELGKMSQKEKDDWLSKIEKGLEEQHKKELEEGLYSISQKDMAGTAFNKVASAVFKELGLKEPEVGRHWLLAGF